MLFGSMTFHSLPSKVGVDSAKQNWGGFGRANLTAPVPPHLVVRSSSDFILRPSGVYRGDAMTSVQ